MMGLRVIIGQLHDRDPEIRVYVFSIKPSLARIGFWPLMQRVNEAYRLLARSDDRIFYVDVATPMLGVDGMPRAALFVDDGLHMSPAGYDVWKAVVREAVMPREADFEKP